MCKNKTFKTKEKGKGKVNNIREDYHYYLCRTPLN